MTDYDIGYGKTDPKTRWKKGQCGNPNRKGIKRSLTIAELIEKELEQKIPVAGKKLTAFEIILRRVIPQIANGNKRAHGIYKKLQAYAEARPTLIVQPDTGNESSAADYRTLIENLFDPAKMTPEEIAHHEAFGRLTAEEAAEVYRETLKRI